MTNALPLRTSAGYLTDGGIVRQVLAPMSPARRALFRFQTLWSLGRRPRDWGVPAAEFLAAMKDSAADRDALLLAAASVALDTGDEAHAGEIFARALADPARSSSPMRYELELQAAMLAAFQGRTVEARERNEPSSRGEADDGQSRRRVVKTDERSGASSRRASATATAPGVALWYAVEGWTVVIASAASVAAFGASLVAVLVAPDAWPAPIVAALVALPGLIVLNAAILFARLRSASPERYDVETGGRGFVRYVGSCGRSFLYQLHGSVVRLSGGDGQLRALRLHVRATLLLHRYAFGLLVAAVVAALALAAFLRLTG